jgi:hypothetical protein
MLCILFSLFQVFVPDAAALVVDIQIRAAILSCAIFSFVVFRVRCSSRSLANPR